MIGSNVIKLYNKFGELQNTVLQRVPTTLSFSCKHEISAAMEFLGLRHSVEKYSEQFLMETSL